MAEGEGDRIRKRDRMKRYVRVPLALRTADLPKRAASAVVMLAVAGGALWLGEAWWAAFVLAVAFGVWFEWSVLAMLFTPPGARRLAWRAAGAVYCAIAAAVLILLRMDATGTFWLLTVLCAVIMTDVGAYFSGRAIGGPKIAPSISPSKTWAGLGGGMVASAATVVIAGRWGASLFPGTLECARVGACAPSASHPSGGHLAASLAIGALIAVIAQAGDFFESWMKRRAGVKDSGKLLPGHGGLFDRVDGLMAVLFLLGLVFMLSPVPGSL